jgi:ABC-type phosphate transport system permease subunit
MENNEDSLKVILNPKNEKKSKWMKLSFSLLLVASFLIILIILLMSSKSNSNEKGLKSLLQEEEKWDWTPKGGKIKTKWAEK